MKSTRRIIVAAVFATTTAFAQPRAAFAATCNEEYWSCLAAAGLLRFPEGELAEIQCVADWVACAVSKLIFW